MNTHSYLSPSITSWLIAAVMCLLPAYRILSQDALQPDAREIASKAALRYYGTNGLSKAAPKDQSMLKHVEIVYGTQLTAEDVDFLSSLENVEELWIGGNLSDEFVSIEGNLTPLSRMKRLRHVFLCKRDVRDDDLAFVAGLSAIESLEFIGDANPSGLDGPFISDDCAAHLCRATNLRDLRISGGDRLTDRFVSLIVRDLRRLEYLAVDSALLTDQSLQMLGDQCMNLRWLELHSDHFTDKGVGYLVNAKNMEMLWLGSKSLTHHCIKSLSGLGHLRHLALTVPTIDDEGVRTIAAFPMLEILVLRQPLLTNDQFEMFSNHRTLQSAFLNGRDLSIARVIEVIKTMPMLDHLAVGDNKPLQAAVKQFLEDRKAAR